MVIIVMIFGFCFFFKGGKSLQRVFPHKLEGVSPSSFPKNFKNTLYLVSLFGSEDWESFLCIFTLHCFRKFIVLTNKL